jgi:hypothetical protein
LFSVHAPVSAGRAAVACSQPPAINVPMIIDHAIAIEPITAIIRATHRPGGVKRV